MSQATSFFAGRQEQAGALPIDAEEISSGLWLGALSAAENHAFIKQQHITHVLTVFPHEPPEVPKSVKLLQIKCADSPMALIGMKFDEACDFIDTARAGGGCVLVHCLCGVSRSATMVCAALMRHEDMTASDALALVRSRRSIADPNPAFLTQLGIFEQQSCARDIDWVAEMNLCCGNLKEGEVLEGWDARCNEWRPARIAEMCQYGFFEVQFQLDGKEAAGQFEANTITLNTGLARRALQ